MTSSCNDIGYYKSIYDHLKRHNSSHVLMLNHGTSVPECFASVGDILITAEMDYQHYQTLGTNYLYS